ncbi:heme peroxidase [Mycena sp. CBHHK59/15]|nr:heme peroxidase [Mycena sp. CBHHK59/15]
MSLLSLLSTIHPNETANETRTRAFELSDLPGYLDALQHFGSLDDRKLLLENLVTLMSRLSLSDSRESASFSKGLQNALIDILYKDLPHPPSSYLSVLAPAVSTPDPIQYAYRNADGSNYVPLFPGLGKAHAPYARSVPSTNITPPATLPDAGLVFDALMRRDAWEPHPGGISALFFAFADLIIHSVFNTNPVDPTINDASSYLDLSILYGSSQAQVDSVRNKDGRGGCGRTRNHNYTAQKILEINENKTYKSEFKDDKERFNQDDEIFNRARLVNCGYFMQIILGDYVGAILGLVRDGYSWRLDPLSQSRETTHELSPRGEGNVCSMEFNLLYRWHATLSKQDTEWTENLFKKLFDGQDFSTITIDDFRNVAHKKMIPPKDVKTWTFNDLKRGPDGRFNDDDLATILQNSTSWRAGAYRARGIPEVLRVIEVLGIEQARRWGACSMNDFRRFLGLKPYDSFKDWNPDKRVHTAAAALYKDIENLELYVGLQAEETKEPMAGAGLCPGYSISRSILADAVCLTRGDRFLTVEFTPSNLTAWGYRDCQFDTQDGSYGGMLTKLLFRTLPAHYPARSAYAHFPFLDPEYMEAYMRENSGDALANKYIWTKPSVHAAPPVVVTSYAGVKAVLADQATFPAGYGVRLATVTGGHEGDQTVVNRILLQDTDKWAAYFGAETQRLIETRSLDHISAKSSAKYVDIVSDVINVLPVHWICQHLAGLPLNTEDRKDEQRHYEMFSDVCRYVFLDSEPSNDWRLRESSVQTFQHFVKIVKEHLGSRFLDWDRASIKDSEPFLKKLDSLDSDSTKLATSLFAEVVPTAAHWSQALAHVVNFYLDDGRQQTRAAIVRLAAVGTKEANEEVSDHVRAALAVDPPVWGIYRTAHKGDTIVEDIKIPASTRVFASIKDANLDKPAAERPILGIGEHGLLSSSFFESTVPQVLGKILGLKNLKRAPGTSGTFNRFIEIAHGVPQQWYVNARSDLVPWPESLVVEYTL